MSKFADDQMVMLAGSQVGILAGVQVILAGYVCRSSDYTCR